MLKRLLYLFVPTTLVAGLLMITAGMSMAKQEYTKKEKKACTYCHTAAGKKDLNDVGKCYAEHNHSLEGCDTKK